MNNSKNTIDGEVSGSSSQIEGTNTTGVVELHKQALQQFMNTIRLPESSEKQQQILNIVKSNPQLLAALIKKRKAQQVVRAAQQIDYKQEFQELQQNMDILESSQSPVQRQQILAKLNSNPQLLAAFIKQRKLAQQADGNSCIEEYLTPGICSINLSDKS